MGKNKPRIEYVVLCGQVVGSGENFEILYNWDMEYYADRKTAIRKGLKFRGSDDFNIGVLHDRKLVSLDWMDVPVGDGKGEPPEVLAAIAEQVGLQP